MTGGHWVNHSTSQDEVAGGFWVKKQLWTANQATLLRKKCGLFFAQQTHFSGVDVVKLWRLGQQVVIIRVTDTEFLRSPSSGDSLEFRFLKTVD